MPGGAGCAVTPVRGKLPAMSDELTGARARQQDIYLAGVSGATPSVPLAPDRLEGRARTKLSTAGFAYIAGGAGAERTMAANRDAFERRRIVLVREILLAYVVLLVFLFLGNYVLRFLRLQQETLSIGGGIVLFLIAIRMIFPREGGVVGEPLLRCSVCAAHTTEQLRHMADVLTDVAYDTGLLEAPARAGTGADVTTPGAWMS